MGVWIVVGIGLFALGSFMGLKPSGIEQRLDKLRMTARRLDLNPKLIVYPDWLAQIGAAQTQQQSATQTDAAFGNSAIDKHNASMPKMIAQYAIIMPNKRLPELCYQIVDGRLRTMNASDKLNDKLNDTPLNLPEAIAPFVKAIYIKANSVVIFWQDTAYVTPAKNPNYDPANIEPDLWCLKQRLQEWANIVES